MEYFQQTLDMRAFSVRCHTLFHLDSEFQVGYINSKRAIFALAICDRPGGHDHER